jgi:hypothetical protein
MALFSKSNLANYLLNQQVGSQSMEANHLGKAIFFMICTDKTILKVMVGWVSFRLGMI